MCPRRFSQPGRALKKHVIERLLAILGGGQIDAKFFFRFFLPNEFVECGRTEIDGQLLVFRLKLRDSFRPHLDALY